MLCPPHPLSYTLTIACDIFLFVLLLFSLCFDVCMFNCQSITHSGHKNRHWIHSKFNFKKSFFKSNASDYVRAHTSKTIQMHRFVSIENENKKYKQTHENLNLKKYINFVCEYVVNWMRHAHATNCRKTERKHQLNHQTTIIMCVPVHIDLRQWIAFKPC